MTNISHITKRKTSKWLSILLTAIMVINLFPASVFAADTPPSQIVSNGEAQSFENGKVKISKTAKQAGENLFDINLEVVTTEEIQEMAISPDAAVVLVMDVSNSMLDQNDGSATSDAEKQRLTQAKAAAQNFINSYTKDLTPEAKRFVSVVEFGSNAHKLMDWQDAATASGKTATNGAINNISNKFEYNNDLCEITGNHSHEQNFTTEANLTSYVETVSATRATFDKQGNCTHQGCDKTKRHYHCNKPGCTNTDKHSHSTCTFAGCENPYDKNHKHCTTPGCALTEDHRHCSFANCEKTDKHTHQVEYDGPHDNGKTVTDSGGTNIAGGLRIANNLIDELLVSNKDYFQANKNVYVVMLTDGAPTFMITDDYKDSKSTTFIKGTSSPGAGNQSNETKCNATIAEAQQIQEKATINAIAYTADTTVCYKQNDGTNYTVGDLLTDTSDQHYAADDTEGLNKIFASIATRIHLLAQAWTVTDPMGANIKLKSIDKAGRGDTVIAVNDKGISWQLREDQTAKTSTVGDTTTYTYTLEYQVELDNTTTGFDSKQNYPTNGKTSLTYILSDENGNLPEDIEKNLKTADFKVPVVKAFTGELEFNKVAAHDENLKLDNAQFQLSLNNDSTKAYVYESLNGLVTFNNIASGHTYTLKETTAPAGYVINPQTYTVQVEYGTPAIYKNNEQGEATSQKITLSQITNKLDPKNIEITVEKQWNAPEGTTLPDAIEVQLMQKVGSAEAKAYGSPVNITKADNWNYQFTNLPTINGETGEAITYTVTETQLEGYDPTYGAFQTVDQTNGKLVITNTINAKRDIPVSKIWNAPADKIPAQLTVKLMNGATEIATATLNADNNWQHNFTGMPTYDASMQAIPYTVVEDTTGLAGFQNPAYDGFTITNTYDFANDTLNVAGTKTWIDGNSENRPTEVALTLYKDGTATDQTVVATVAGNWNYAFNNLPKYDATTLQAINYTVVDEATGYECTTGTAENNYSVTNTIKQEYVPISGDKTWGTLDEATNPRPDSIQLCVYANGEKTDKTITISKVAAAKTEVENAVAEITNSAWAENTTFDFNAEYGETAFPMYDKDGNKITYTVREETVAGFEPIYSQENFDIKNILDGGQTSIAVTKIWNDPYTDENRPTKAVTIKLMNGTTEVTSVELNAANKWQHTFAGLQKYNDGKAIEYTVAEATLDGYQTPAITGSQETGYTITNQITPATMDINGTKTWVGAATATRPEITINLLQNGKQIQTTTTLAPTADNQKFTYAFTGLDKYDANGDLYTYTVSENEVTGYTTAINGYDITNTFKQSNITVSGDKNWVVPANTTLPASITVQLYRDGSANPVATQEVKPVDNKWQYSFTAPKYDFAGDGHEYSYTVKEVAIDGYISSVNPTDKRTITNTSKQQNINIPVSKIWVGPAAAAVKVQLCRSIPTAGTIENVTTLTLTEKTNWQGTFENMPKYNDNRQEYTYTIKEATKLDAYDTKIEGSTITNTIKQVATTVAGTKTWKDTPANLVLPTIKVQLYADNVAVTGKEATTTATDNWKYSFDNLPTYALDNNGDGHKIKYTVKEVGELNNTISYGDDHYTVAYDGMNITNTYKESDQYAYHIVCNYTTITDGVKGEAKTVRGERVLGNKGTIVTPTPASYNTFENNKYEFTNGTPVNTAGKVELTLSTPNVDEEIVLNYQRTVTTPVEPPTPPSNPKYRTITINYLEDGTNKVLATKYTKTTALGNEYDVTANAALAIKGYSLDRVEGDDLKGVILNHLEINVYYTPDTVIIDPTVPLNPTPDPVNPPAPDKGGAAIVIPDLPSDGEIIIVDENTPLGDLPKTGADAMSQPLAIIILASLLIAAFGILDIRKERKTITNTK